MIKELSTIEDVKKWVMSEDNKNRIFLTDEETNMILQILENTKVEKGKNKLVNTKLITLINTQLKNYVISQEEQYKTFVAQLTKNAKKSLPDLENINFGQEKEKEVSIDLIYLFQDLIFFPNNNIEETFPKVGLKPILKWLIPLNKIRDEIDKINKIDGIYLPPHTALYHINEHLKFKLMNDIQLVLGQSGKRIRKTKKGDDYSNFYMELINKSRSKKFKAKKKDIKLFNGKTEKYILKELYNCIIINAVAPLKAEKRSEAIYDFFKLIMPETKTICNKEDFLNIYGAPSDRENFKRYQHRMLNKEIGLE